MLKFPGSSALSTFRINRLVSQLQAIEPSIHSLTAQFIHFVDVADELSNAELSLLKELLSYGVQEVIPNIEGERWLVVPRSGTISPWSSKATEIAQRCGLATVKRIERGIEYSIAANSGLSGAAKKNLSPLLFDRMT